MEDMNLAIRLKGFIDSQGLTHSQFADQAGIPRPSLSQILSGRNKKISDVIVGQIHKAFPRLSVLWLMFGEGDMLVPDPVDTLQPAAGDNLFADNPDFMSNPLEFTPEPNVSELNTTAKSLQIAESKIVECNLRIAELQKQIDKLSKNPRKVSHITVYYDDSTFETFFPKG